MKRILFLAVFAALAHFALAQSSKAEIVYTDAQNLTFLGKMCNTTNPYHRVEVDNYEELNSKEKALLRMSAGLYVAFETDAKEVWVKAQYGKRSYNTATPVTAACGFNLWIKKDGEWLWAASVAKKDARKDGNLQLEEPTRVIGNMELSNKQCLLYLPLFAELTSLELGVPEGSILKPVENPFRYNIAIFGSSFTHGACASYAGGTYPGFFTRKTGLYLCGFGMSGNSKLQRVMGEILGGTECEALICDAFSNPTIDQISQRIRPFLDAFRQKKPEVPVIFLRTIYRENRIFDLKSEKKEQDRIDFVDGLMKQICSEYKDVYFVDVADQTGVDHLTSADGIHPTSWGYKRWADAIEQPVLDILAKYGIK